MAGSTKLFLDRAYIGVILFLQIVLIVHNYNFPMPTILWVYQPLIRDLMFGLGLLPNMLILWYLWLTHEDSIVKKVYALISFIVQNREELYCLFLIVMLYFTVCFNLAFCSFFTSWLINFIRFVIGSLPLVLIIISDWQNKRRPETEKKGEGNRKETKKMMPKQIRGKTIFYIFFVFYYALIYFLS